MVIRPNGARPGQPGAQITVPLSTLQGLQAGQGIPTGQPGHLLVKTEKGQYQILRVGPPGQQGGPPVAAVSNPSATVAASSPQQPHGGLMRPVSVPATSSVVMRPNQPQQIVQQVRHPTVSSAMPTPPIRPNSMPNSIPNPTPPSPAPSPATSATASAVASTK